MKKEVELILSKTRKAFEAEEYGVCCKYYREARDKYPQWLVRFDFMVGLLGRRYPLYHFGWSYEVEQKEVSARPENFPTWLRLPELQGVGNNYSHIDERCCKYWSVTGRKPSLGVSVVVPVYNRSIELDFVLAGLTHQTYPKELIEVVIADDGSQEDISKIFNKYSRYFEIKYVKQDDLGYRVSAARNLGINAASHNSIIVLDSDAIPNSKLVENYMRYFHVERNAALFGLRYYVSVANLCPDDYIQDEKCLLDLPRIQSENNVTTRLNNIGQSIDWRESLILKTDLLKNENLPYRFLVGANCAFSRELFEKVGGYSEEFRDWGFDDQEFGYRLLREGAYFIPLMDNYVFHQEPPAGKNDTDRKLGEAKTKPIFIEKCPFVHRKGCQKNKGFEAPLVSIYIPLFNREKYIAECVQSALEQSVKDLEVVICNDGSTDYSAEIVNKYFGNNPRVRIINQKNGGIGSASNTAVMNCRGFFIGQLDGDDVLKRDAVSRCLEAINKNPNLSLVYGATEYIDENSKFISPGWNWPVFSREYLMTRMIVHHFRFFRKRDWCRTGGFDETIKNAVDYDMMLKLAEVGEVEHLNRVLYQYRKHNEMTSVVDKSEQDLNNFFVIQNSLKRLGLENIRVGYDGDISERKVKFSLGDYK